MAASRKILVVDDDPWIAKMLEFVATDAGHVAVVCKDGYDAIEKFAEVMPDLVLLDVVLPKLDGLKVCEHIKKTPIGRLTPVLVFSGIYRDSTEALKFGADAFLAKPFTPQQMGQQIRQMLPPRPAASASELAAPPLKAAASEVSLAAEPLARALGRLHKAQATGVLTVRSRTGIKYLFVEKGSVVQVRSPSTAAGVTTALLARGRVSTAQLEEQEKRARESGGKKILSQILVESGLVRAEELRKLVLGQMLAEMYEVFGFREGFHAFVESPPLPASAGQFKLEVPTPNLVHWGVRKMETRAGDLDRLVPSRLTFLARSADCDELVKPLLLTERERAILTLIDGSKTVQEIASIVDLAGGDALPTLYTLLSLGAVAPAPPASGAAPRFEAESSAAPSAARSLQGPFALALMELWRNKETGLVKCISPLDNRAVYVSRGVPIFARSERNADRLDQLLVRQGVITPDQVQKSLELQARTPHKRIGQILIEMSAISLEQLHATVKAQVQNLVLSLFTWAEGKYLFEPGPLPTQEAITLDWDTPGAVLQGLRGLPLNHIRPLAPPKDSIIERAPDARILSELQLNGAERKLLALLVGRHPMEQLLALDFIAVESLLRGLVTFAALGLITVHRGTRDDDEGIDLDPLADPGSRDPAYVKTPPLVPPVELPLRPVLFENAWPDPTPAVESEPGESWTAPQRRSFLSGPAMAAFDAEVGVAPPHVPARELEPAPQEAEAGAQEQWQGEPVENEVAQHEAAKYEAAQHEATQFEAAEAAEPAPAEPEPYDSAFAFAAPDDEQAVLAPPAPAPARPRYAAAAPPAASEGAVPRALYDAAVAEKQALQQKLLAVLQERRDEATVPRELFDQVQAEKRQLQEKMMLMLDELLRLRQQPAEEKEQRGNVRPFPGSRKNE